MSSDQFFMIDFPALIIVVLASILCALLGSFLVLKKQAVMVDAISHSVLPGIVMAVLLSGTFSMIYVMSGALLSALIAISLVYMLQHWAKIEQGAAIGSVFTTLFAIGVILLETKIGTRVHLDTQHVLYGALELTYWAKPFEWESMPVQIKTLGALLLITCVFMALLFKELRLTTFDPVYAKIRGYRVDVLQFSLMILMSLVAVGCFEATGSILVIALFICPAACARLVCNRMEDQMVVSTMIAVSCGVFGYFVSAILPTWYGIGYSVNSAAAIAVTLGGVLITICGYKFLCSPKA
ncbi:MAG: metal ABC transporter permease [Alphaproteobacteria bacterium]